MVSRWAESRRHSTPRCDRICHEDLASSRPGLKTCLKYLQEDSPLRLETIAGISLFSWAAFPNDATPTGWYGL